MYAENEPAMERSDAVLNDLLGKLYIIDTDDSSSDSWCKSHVNSQLCHTGSPN